MEWVRAFFPIERSHKTYVDVKFDEELIPDAFMKFKDSFDTQKHKKQLKTLKKQRILEVLLRIFLWDLLHVEEK